MLALTVILIRAGRRAEKVDGVMSEKGRVDVKEEAYRGVCDQ